MVEWIIGGVVLLVLLIAGLWPGHEDEPEETTGLESGYDEGEGY